MGVNKRMDDSGSTLPHFLPAPTRIMQETEWLSSFPCEKRENDDKQVAGITDDGKVVRYWLYSFEEDPEVVGSLPEGVDWIDVPACITGTFAPLRYVGPSELIREVHDALNEYREAKKKVARLLAITDVV